MVDYGIGNQNLSFVTVILIAQLILFISQAIVDFIRSWILLHITARVNISMISDFLIKLMNLPIRFFDVKMIGDIMQRIKDNSRIQNFLTSSSLNTLFSFINLIIFSVVLGFYNLKILGFFMIGSILYVLWIILFLKKRKELDYKRFAQASVEQSNLYQLINGMQEIKLNNCEKQKQWEWESIQAKLFKVNIKGLALAQYQQAGAFCIDQTKNIVISFFAAQSVINGSMTLGMMMAVQYIIGQLNSPLVQFINFIQSAQDAKISLERLDEIHNKDDEEDSNNMKQMLLPKMRNITLHDVQFRYDKTNEMKILDDINLEIANGKITAIVGKSGSGKTTLIKLLLGFYQPEKGVIKIGETNLQDINSNIWRKYCGAVLQDGYIFSDTISNNIALGENLIDVDKMHKASKIANIHEIIERLPLGYNTKIGQEGQGISHGQRQRILIARAAYKNPTFLFFDEATNSLDANNENSIMKNLRSFFEGKTVVVVAHRLSTVINADKIVVMEKGKIIEQGSHKELLNQKGIYYDLVKSQLDLEK